MAARLAINEAATGDPAPLRSVVAAVHSPGARCNSLNRLVPLRLLRWRRSLRRHALPSLAPCAAPSGAQATRRYKATERP